MEDTYKSDHLLGKRSQNDWTKEDLEEFAVSTTTRHGITIPVNVEIEADQKNHRLYLNESNNQESIQNCDCRLCLPNTRALDLTVWRIELVLWIPLVSY